MQKLQNIIGLFGTSGNSVWREPVMHRLEEEGIPYFNPVVKSGWKPEMAVIEAEHLATDRVILFVITGETESLGSLAETGWAALSGLKNGQTVLFVVQDYEPQINWVDKLVGADNYADAAVRTRKLVRAHMQKTGIPIYETVADALEAAVKLFHAD
ncbi:MAG: hypothetical protein GY796_06180 [Chloroflexi bacterium]|nr:hypothetical protein [Chloroflexota bacterium]